MSARLAGTVAAAVLAWAAFLAGPPGGSAAFLYKNYIVKYDKGSDVLCDPYVVRRNDWVIKLFKQKGEIAHEDFPEFLNIFRRINPHIQDVDRIRPGQRILIPLRKMPLGTLPGQDSGKVTIPFVTIHSLEGGAPPSPGTYRVRKGDTVSELISARFGRFGSAAYRAGLQRFRELNPQIRNLDLIYAGSDLRIPAPEAVEEAPRTGFPIPKPPPGPEGDAFVTLLADLAHAMGGRLMHQGIYYFPSRQGFDVPLDLSRTPVVELPGGMHLIFADEAEAKTVSWDLLREYWPDTRRVEADRSSQPKALVTRVMEALPPEMQLERLSFSDKGLAVEVGGQWLLEMAESDAAPPRQVAVSLIDASSERTAPAIRRYLEQRDILVRDYLAEAGAPGSDPDPPSPAAARVSAAWVEKGIFSETVFEVLSAMGYPAKRKVKVSFPYAGLQIEAVSNLVSTEEGNPIFIDFGDLYGDAGEAIRKSGFEIIQLKGAEADLEQALHRMLEGLRYETRTGPTFSAAERAAGRSTTLTVPGILAEKDRGEERERVLLSFVPLNGNITYFLQEMGIRVVFVTDAVQ